MGIKTVQLSWEAVWQFLEELNIELAHDPAILLLGLYRETWNPMFIQKHANK